MIYTVVEKFKRISPYLLVLYMGWSIAVDVIEKVEQLSVEVRELNHRTACLEAQITKTKGFGFGLAVGLIGVSSGTAAIITKWMT